MKLKKIITIDWIILIFTISLNIIGLFTLYSISTSNVRGSYFINEFQNQIIYSIIGYIFLTIFIIVPFFYFKFGILLGIVFTFNLALLIYTAFWGIEINGVRRWLILGTHPNSETAITIQPSEFAKIVLILVNSIILSNAKTQKAEIILNIFSQKEIKINKYYILSLVLSTLIITLIFLQKSLSVTLVLIAIYLFMLISSVHKKTKFLIIGIASLLVITLSQQIFAIDYITKIVISSILIILMIGSFTKLKIHLLKPLQLSTIIFINFLIGFFGISFIWENVLHQYQKERIVNFINFNDQDLLSEGYQQYQSIISIGAGNLFGQGFMQIVNDRVLLLPEPTTDFIFAIFAYKFGFTGVIFVLLIYSILILRIFYMADKLYDNQSQLILIGVGSMILIQVFVNIGMNLGILPVGGTTLPLISAGGSSLISMFMSIGLVQNCIATDSIEKKVAKRNDKILINGWNI